MTSDNNMKREWECDSEDSQDLGNTLIKHKSQVDTVNNAIPNTPAKYRIKCYTRNDDLILTTNSMTSMSEWLGNNDGYALTELVR